MVERQPVLARQCIHRRHKVLEPVPDDEILTLVHEGLDRRWRVLAEPLQEQRDALAGQIRVLFRTGKRKLLLDDRPRQDEPAVVVTTVADRLQCAERIEARHRWRGKTVAVGVAPEG
ncbi:hypothetical protein D9M70_520460 [compost metagenome]